MIEAVLGEVYCIAGTALVRSAVATDDLESLVGPIFLVGTGRCGSTIVYSLLAMHPDLAWIPSWMNLAPLPALAFFNRAWDLPGMDRFRERRFFPKPVEPNRVFHWLLPDYYVERTDQDVLARTRACLVPLIEKVRHYHGRPRFLCKMVGRPVKVRLLAEVYPDAFFVHVTRALKPTVASFMQVDFYRATEPLPEWPWEPVPPEFLHYYEQTGHAEEVAAAIKEVLNRRALERQLAALNASRRTELRYADFVRDPVTTLGDIAAKSGLTFGDELKRRVGARHVAKDNDEKWRRFFTATEVRNLDGFQELLGAPTDDTGHA